jgi:phage FluMu protein Com
MNNLIVCPLCKKVISQSKYKRHLEKRCTKQPRNHWHESYYTNEWQLMKKGD